MFWSGSTAIDGLWGNVTAGYDTATDSAGRCNRIWQTRTFRAIFFNSSTPISWRAQSEAI